MKKIVAFIAVLIYMTCAGTVWGQTLSNPQDVTWRITNPNFDSNADGWNGSPSWYQKCVEKWNEGIVDVYQELTGLPAGLYSVSVDGFYRPGSSSTTLLDRHALLYANESSTPLWHINVSRETEILETEDKTITIDGQTYYVPFNRLSASRYFAKGVYTDNRVWVIVPEDGNLRIGIKKDVVVESDWICFDNFQLTYYGTSMTYYLRNRQAGTFLTQGNAWGTQATLHETGIDFEVTVSEDGKYSFDSKVERTEGTSVFHHLGSNGYVDAVKDAFTLEPKDGRYYTISLDGNTNLLVPGTGTTAVFSGTDENSTAAHWELLTRDQLISELDNASFGNPMNATFFIPGFDFCQYDTRNNQWIWSNCTKDINGTSSSSSSSRCAKASGANFDVYQELTGLPAGTYILTAYACFQNGADANSTGVSAYLYAGSKQVALPTINDGGEKPTNHGTAANAFAAGRYQTLQVTVQVGSDGNLRIGVKNNSGNGADFAYFDNFHLTYLGEKEIDNPYTGPTATYYLQNVATGEYLQGGAEYGVRPVLGNGIEFRVEKVYDGIYNLYSDIKHTEGYLCDEGYMDHGKTNFIIQEQSNGIYTIATTDKTCNNLNPNYNGTFNRLLTVGGTSLSNFAFSRWTQVDNGTVENTPADGFKNEIGSGAELGKGGTIFGDDNVYYLNYADLTGYKIMKIKGTPGAYIQIRLNRKNGNEPFEGDTEFIEIGKDGWVSIDLSKYSNIHLNSIKHAWESPKAKARIESITLYKDDRGHVASFVAGADASANVSQWRFVTEAERIAALNEATRTNPKDATFLIKGASFTEGDQRVADKWKIDGGHWFYHYRDDDKQTDGAGGVVNLGVSSGATSCDIYQTVTGLPDGVYEVSMQGCYHNFKDAVFYANSVSVALDKCGDEFSNCINATHSSCICRQTASVQTYGTDKYKKTLKVIVTDGTLRVGAKGSRSDSNNFLIFDNFKLTYLGAVLETKSYYVRNVATGDFIRAGGRYEAQAIRDDWGLALNLIYVDNETVVIDSRISNATYYQYLGANGYLDSGQTFFTLETVGDKYAIRTADGKYLATADGDNYVNFDRGVQSGDTHAQWELLTRDQLIEELKNSSASDSNPKDATFLIEGSNFGRHDLRNNSTNWQGIDFNDGKYGGVESSDWNSPDNYANSAVEKYSENFDTYQTISGLPAGTYELTVQGYYRSGNTATAADKTNAGTDLLRPILYVKQGENLIGQVPLQSVFDGGMPNQTNGFSTSANGEWLPNSLSDAAKVFRDGHYMPSGEYNKVRFVVPSDGATVQIGVKKNVLYDSDWTAFDNFRLTYLGDTGETQTVYEHEIGTTLGTYYLKNAQTGTYLTAGGTDGVSAVLGDQMHQHSVYNNETKYQKGVRETDFTFVVAKAEGYSIQTGIGDGYLTRDNGVKVNGMLDGSKGSFILEEQGNNTYRIKHSSGSYLRYTTESGKKDTEIIHSWDFTRTLTSDEDFTANTTNWEYEYNNGVRWYYKPVTNKEALLIGNKELDDAQGLLFTGGTKKMIVYRNSYLRLNGKDIVVTIPGLKAGDKVTIVTNSPKAEDVANRYLTNPTNLQVIEGFKSMSSNDKWNNIATVVADGEVSFSTSNGINIYSIKVTREVDSSGLGFENTDAPNGDGYNWIFQTKDNLLAEFKDASESTPIDATFLLRGTAFHKDDSRNSAWTGKPEVGGTESNYVGSASGRTYNISQTLTDLPAGIYEFTLQGYHTNENGINEQARYYVSTDVLQQTLITKNTSGATTFINARNYAMPGETELSWKLDFQNGTGGVPIPDVNKDYGVTISEAINSNIGTITINGISIINFGLQTGTTWLQRHTSKGVKGLYSNNGGPRNIGFRGLKAGQIVCIQTSNGTAFDAVDKAVLQKISETTDEVIFRVLQDQADDVYSAISVQRYTYIYKVEVYNKKNPTSLDLSDASTASSLFADAADKGVHPVIRFEVPDDERKMVTLGVFDAIKDADALYIDNIRLTYLGTSVTEGIATPQKLIRGIHHKRSRYYELAAENGHLTFDDYNTVNEASNKTTLSNETMVKHEHVAGRMIQHTPVFRDTIYARAGEELEIVLPSSYSDLNQSSGKYYQRLYNYKTDGLFVEDAVNTGVFDLGNSYSRDDFDHISELVPYADADIRKLMEVYEGSDTAPAGGWVFGRRWNRQLVSKFNFTTPTNASKFSTLDHAIEIAVDYTDLPDVGDMGMFGDLTEPTLVQRAIFVIVPSQVMADKLNACTGDKFLEVKSISFPTIWYGLNTNDLNAVALDKQVRNYFTTANTEVDWKNISISLTENGTGVTLNTTSFGSGTDRFIKFNYPQGGEVTNLQTEYLTVQSNGKNIAKFILDFVPNTELRPWKDIMGQATLSRSPIYMDNHAQLIDVLNFDKSYRKEGGEAVYHPGTWPIGDETSINGIERDTVVKNPSQFNPYPLDFEQTTFGAYYPRAIWSQYSVMKRLYSYNDRPGFKDVNQLYHDYFSTQDGTGDLLQKYQGGGYFMYIDASNFPSSVARLTMEEKLCEGTTIHFSGWVSSMDLSTDIKNAPGYLLFSIVGIDASGNESVIESFCPGPIRADGKSYAGETVKYDSYHTEIGWTDSYSIWQQFAFSFVIKADVASKYEEYALKIDNYCSSTSGGDMMVDDVRLYIHKAVPDVMQSVPVCSPGDMSGVEIYTDFDQLLSAVNMQETASEQEAYNGYENKQAGGKIIPTAWYCFLDKKKYDEGIAALTSHTTEDYDAVFNNALVTTGGGTGYHSFTFSTCYASNNGGLDSYRDTYTNSGGTSSTQVVSYAARKGDGTDKRIYFNPESIVPLNTLSYYQLSNGTWNKVNPVWSLEKDSAGIVYGDNSGNPERYVDLSAYDELRIYQSDADVNQNGPVRCFFFPKESELASDNTKNIVVSTKTLYDGKTADLEFERNNDGGYWIVDLEKVKDLTGQAKLISIKASKPNNTSASVTAINVVRKSVELEPSKDYYIVFKAYKGKTGETSVGGPSIFFNMTSDECTAMSEFRLVPNSMARFDGTLDSEGGDEYCAGQIATLKMEMQGFDSNNMAITLEDLPYDWWIGDKGEFMTKASDDPASPNDVLFAFREEYPEATTYEGQEAKETFTSAYKTAMKQWIKDGKLYLYKTSQNVRVENTGSDGQMEIMVSPILSFLEGLTSFQYCDPIEVYINVSGSAPHVKDGFVGTTYPMDEVPLRIGLAQIQSVKDETADSWKEENNALYIPLRDIKFSGETGYNKGFGKKKHNWGTDSSNTLDIAAVYLTETDDPAMVSYGADVDSVGNRELRYVGKVHVFQAALNKGKFEDYVKLTFNPEFANNAKEGYRYVLKTSFEETNESGAANPCHGDLLIPLYIVPEYQVWAGGADGNWANDANWRRAENEELKFAATTDRLTNEANTTSQGFVPMDFTKVLMKSDSVAVLKNELGTDATTDIQFHLAAKEKGANADAWLPSELKGTDIYCVSFYNNTAKEVHFEPHSQMLNTQYLTYEQAWVEYALESGRWYTLSSPLQGVVSGDMYLPRGTAKQATPYFAPITYNNADYSRLEPAVYQQAWDKAEATLYRLERDHLMGGKQLPATELLTPTANVARAFDWSYAYNDVKVPFGVNGFSVKVDVSRIEGYAKEEGVKDVLLRLPKKDNTYNYYMYDDNSNGSQTVNLTTTLVNGKNLREQAGKLFTDGMPAAGMTVTLTNNSADNPYFLVGNPFMSGLDLDEFFKENGGLETKYWILTKDSYSASIKTGEQWASTDEFTTGNVAPLQAFFVKKIDGKGGTLDVTFTSEMAVQLAGEALQTRASGAPAALRLTAMRDGVESRAIVVCREEATEGFNAGEDAEALFDSNLSHAPTLYTAAGEVAAAINVRRTLHGVPVGIASDDEDEVTLTFDGVENFGEELYLYDAAEGISTLIPDSKTAIQVAGNSHGRYYLVTTPLDGSAQESVPVVTLQGRMVTILSAFDEILSIEAFDAMGNRVYAEGAVGNRTRFTLPSQGVYLITVKTAAGVFTHKVLAN